MLLELPPRLVHLIKTSKYLHLATCGNDCGPSISLMNYIYVPVDKSYDVKEKCDYIIFATSENTEKFFNMLSNPTVSLLFHDWIAADNLSVRKKSISNSTNNNERLADFLEDLNESELNQISAHIKGEALLINPLGPENNYYKNLLLRANPDADVFVNGENVVLIKVKMQTAKVTNSENNIIIYK